MLCKRFLISFIKRFKDKVKLILYETEVGFRNTEFDLMGI